LLGIVTGPGSLAQVMGSSLAILVRKINFSFHQPAWVMGDDYVVMHQIKAKIIDWHRFFTII
jgi:hypothetical protein